MTGIPDHICDVLDGAHDALIDIAAAADFVRRQIRIGHNGEGTDEVAALDAIHEDAITQAAKIMALVATGKAE